MNEMKAWTRIVNDDSTCNTEAYDNNSYLYAKKQFGLQSKWNPKSRSITYFCNQIKRVECVKDTQKTQQWGHILLYVASFPLIFGIPHNCRHNNQISLALTGRPSLDSDLVLRPNDIYFLEKLNLLDKEMNGWTRI